MPQTDFRRALMRGALAMAVCGAVLRSVFLMTAFDGQWLLPRGSRVLLITVVFSLAMFGGLWFLSSRLNRLPGTEGCFTSEGRWLFGKLAAASLLFFGGGLSLLGMDPAAEAVNRWAALGTMAAALSLAVTALARSRGTGLFWVRLVLPLMVGLNLVLRFRDWSHDPLVIHITPALLTYACALVESTLLTGFPLGAGHRRSAVLFGLAGACFACMGLPDYVFGLHKDLGALLTLLGPTLWGLTAALELLRESVQTEEAPADSGELPGES